MIKTEIVADLNMSLERLADMEDLSTRAVNICRNLGLTSLSQIIEFYSQSKSFKQIENCGSRTEKELIDICKKYQKTTQEQKTPSPILEESTDITINILANNISLADLIIKENLTARAINACQDAGLNSLLDIIGFYQKKKSFIFIRNCGSTTNNELTDLCKKYQNGVTQVNLNDLNTKYNKIISLTEIQKKALTLYLENLLVNLSARAKNGLEKISPNLNPSEILDTIFLDRFKFNGIQNIGEKSVSELNLFKIDIYNFLEKLLTLNNKEVKQECIIVIIKNNFKNLSEGFIQQINSIFDSNGKIKLFRLLELLLNSECVFNANENRIFRFAYTNSNSCSKTLNSIGQELGISRERVRQIKIKLENYVQENFSFISDFELNDLVDYSTEDSIQIINADYSENINRSEDVSFNPKFYSEILSFLYKNPVLKLKNKSADENNIKRPLPTSDTYYVIPTSMYNGFSFEEFFKDVYSELNKKRIQIYSPNLDTYISRHLKVGNEGIIIQIKMFCQTLLSNELGLIIDLNGNLNFTENTPKQLYDYYFEILDDNSNPMTLNDIAKSIGIKYPNIATNIDSMRSTLLRKKDMFICFGRTSTYGLKKWENEKENLKGGTIKDIIEEYLLQFENPKHISEILTHLLNYRENTNERSVLINLKDESSNRFTFYNGDFIGLLSKHYSLDAITFKKTVGSHFRSSALKKMNGWSYEKVVNHYVKNLGYENIHVRAIIQKKIADGISVLKHDNTLHTK
jgi:hypothetical protein